MVSGRSPEQSACWRPITPHCNPTSSRHSPGSSIGTTSAWLLRRFHATPIPLLWITSDRPPSCADGPHLGRVFRSICGKLCPNRADGGRRGGGPGQERGRGGWCGLGDGGEDADEQEEGQPVQRRRQRVRRGVRAGARRRVRGRRCPNVAAPTACPSCKVVVEQAAGVGRPPATGACRQGMRHQRAESQRRATRPAPRGSPAAAAAAPGAGRQVPAQRGVERHRDQAAHGGRQDRGPGPAACARRSRRSRRPAPHGRRT